MCNFGLSECNRVNLIALRMAKTPWILGHLEYKGDKETQEFALV